MSLPIYLCFVGTISSGFQKSSQIALFQLEIDRDCGRHLFNGTQTLSNITCQTVFCREDFICKRGKLKVCIIDIRLCINVNIHQLK